ncbi:MAG: UDP-N-acetylglucosamine 4,6-dehydratase (inverting) [Theionarchaea archaeon]|nr:MAG: UDP-N-acetylglucosamine 4,6-dehydratase (inverting) [Theionarchaea archaeon DG-70-1]MBU7025607.1 UDP-N-acetylglucosamine 4,6-dehydratase (inverting) [Theionarchaea archaeon]
MAILDGKVVLVTGGTGSFGREFIRIALNEHNPKSIRVYSRGELRQMKIRNYFNDERLRFLIGDVRDKHRLYRAMNGTDICVHAAALKQVPTCEYNPIEAIRTNVDGSVNVVDAAIDNSVEKVMLISTDKAVHPVNLYGATKMVAEKLFIQGNSYTGGRRTKFSCVRYGNVIGSRGSVVPLFKKQKEEGVLTITDERMTRFWIAIQDGVRFVADCIERMKGGEIFVPKIPSMRVVDLADTIAPDCEKRITGIRAGEKLHEILLTEEEARHTKDHGSYFIIEPEHPFWKEDSFKGGTPLPEGFRYMSNTNDQWLTGKELMKMVAAHD